MPEGGEPTAWDFLTLLNAWNLYALPALLFAAGLVVVLRNRRFEPQERRRYRSRRPPAGEDRGIHPSRNQRSGGRAAHARTAHNA